MKLSDEMRTLAKIKKDCTDINHVLEEIKHQAKNGNYYLKVDAYFLSTNKFLKEFLENEGFDISFENDMVGIISWR